MSSELESKIKEIIVKIGKTFNIDNVPLLIQMIVKDNEVNVIEFSARTGGGSKLFFIREMVKVDIIDNLLDITFGLKPDIEAIPCSDKAVIKYVYAEPGIFSDIQNLEELKASGYITNVYQYKPFGTEIKSSNYSSDRPIGFLLRGASEGELAQKVSHINSRIKILDENGKDIMRHDIFEGK